MQGKFNIGDIVNGFELVSIEEIPDYKSIGMLFKHIKTGFQVYALSNDDSECFFNYTVYTPATDNSGVFHILEHTVLTGSEKYPVRDPFMAMIRNSCNTFLNAMTGPDRTYYPAASPVKKDFDNIFNVYTDAVFCPLLRKESFMQEGIRMSENGGLHFEGVVFSEMQGDISQHDSVVSSSSTRPLFDNNSPYKYEFGGNPPDICDLTYEKFIETYKKYYVPANMTLFLYGNIDIEEKLSFLDREYLSHRDGGVAIKRAEMSSAWKEPRFYRATSNSEEGKISSTTMLSWLLGDSSEPNLNTELSLLVDLLLGSPGSPLYKAIIDSSLGRDLSSESGMSDSFRELVFAVGVDGTEENDARKVEDFILSTLADIANKGFDRMEIEASIRRMEFKLQEIPSGMPQGYTLFFSRIDKGWAYGRNPSDMLFAKDGIKRIREKLEENPNYFSSFIRDNLLNNSHRLLSVVVMDKDTQKRLDQKIKDKVKEHKGQYSRKEEDDFHLFEAGFDSDEQIAKLPKLTIDDIPNLKLDYSHQIDGRIIKTDFKSGGVVYCDMAFDVSDFSYKELEDLSLLSRLLLMTNVSDMDLSTFLTSLRLSTGDANISLESGSMPNGETKVYLYVRFKSLFEYLDDALSLFKKLFEEADLKSMSRIKATLLDIESDFQASVVRSAHQFAISNASSSLSATLYKAERTSGLEFWYRIEEMISSEMDDLSERLMKIYDKVFVSSRMLFHISTDSEILDSATASAKAFIKSIQSGDGIKECVPDVFKPSCKNRAYTFSTPVNYIAYVFDSGEQDSKEAAAEKMLLSICCKNSLWALIREKGGAYGAGGATDSIEHFSFIYSYRDPRTDDSIRDFSKAIEIEDLTQSKVEDAKIAILSRDVKPLGPSSKAMIDFRRYLYGIPDELRHRRKDMMLSVCIDDLIKSKAGLLDKMNRKASISIIADLPKVEKSKYNFEIENLPFK